MTQERQRVRIEKKQYFDRNIWDMSIDITYFVWNILQVVISRSTYYISFERMCLTVLRELKIYLTLHLIETPVNAFASRKDQDSTEIRKRVDPDQAAYGNKIYLILHKWT